MATLNWINPNWSPLPYTVSYSINQPTAPDKYSLVRQRSDGTSVSLGEGFTSLAAAQAAAQADCDQNFRF